MWPGFIWSGTELVHASQSETSLHDFAEKKAQHILTLLCSELPKLCRVLAVLSAIGLKL